MRAVVVALGGPPASGKTTVARAVGEALGAPRVGFGELVRAETRKRQLAPNRTVWQEVGQQLLAELGPEGLVRAALERASLSPAQVPVVWDGVRHTEAAYALQATYPSVPVILTILRPPEAERHARFLSEAGSIEQLRLWEGHESEGQLEELGEMADLVWRGPAIDEAVDAVMRLVRATRHVDAP